MSLNSRKDDDILNDLHSAQGRFNSSKIIDLKTELETNEMKEKIHRANMENEIAEVDKEQDAKIKKLEESLFEKEGKVDMSKKPKELTAKELEEEKKKATLQQGFSWSLNKRNYDIGNTNHIPFIVVKLEEEAYNNLSTEQKKKFKKESLENGESLYVSSRGKEKKSEDEKNRKKIENETGLPIGYNATKKGKRNFVDIRLKEITQQGPDKFKELLESTGTIDKNSIEKAVKYLQNGNNKDKKNLNILLADYRSDIEKKLFEKHPAIQMNTAQLSEQLKGKRILFYTGAGLSIGGGIPLMSGLQEKMGIKYGDVISDQFLERFLDSPEKAYAPRNEFTETSINGKPTPGHYATKSLANKFGCQILTENIDCLQKNTGIMEYHTTGDFLRNNISEEDDLKKIDYIIVVGLSNDDRGLFQRYKDVNPNGKIVAFNIDQPNYLGEDDILVKGDIQKTLPELDKVIQNKTANEEFLQQTV